MPTTKAADPYISACPRARMISEQETELLHIFPPLMPPKHTLFFPVHGHCSVIFMHSDFLCRSDIWNSDLHWPASHAILNSKYIIHINSLWGLFLWLSHSTKEKWSPCPASDACMYKALENHRNAGFWSFPFIPLEHQPSALLRVHILIH